MSIYSIAIKHLFPKIMAVCLLQLLELQKAKLLYVHNQRLYREDIAILLHEIKPLYSGSNPSINNKKAISRLLRLCNFESWRKRTAFFGDQLLYGCEIDILCTQPLPSVKWFNFQQHNGYISSAKSLQPVQLVYFSLTVCTTSVTLSVIQSFINLIVWSICCCWRWNPTGWLWGLPCCCHHDAP